MGKKALVTGITGQDGSYLARLLLDEGYEVHGIIRRTTAGKTERLDQTTRSHPRRDAIKLHFGDMTDTPRLMNIVGEVAPDEIYNLAAQSHVQYSFEMPEHSADVNGMGVLRLLEAVRFNKLDKTTRFYQASTSELFGLVQETPQKETTPFYPRSPYGVAKLFAFWIVRNYRESYGMYACNGILFNHESPLRGEAFVTRKITKALARIKLGKQESVSLGNLSALRDWGHAADYVRMQWMMLQQKEPDDFVIATGEQHTVREFAEISAARLGIGIDWQGEGVNEKGIDKATGKTIIKVDPQFFRPAEVQTLLGDPTKAKEKLGWVPKITFAELVTEMVDNDLKEESAKPD